MEAEDKYNLLVGAIFQAKADLEVLTGCYTGTEAAYDNGREAEIDSLVDLIGELERKPSND